MLNEASPATPPAVPEPGAAKRRGGRLRRNPRGQGLGGRAAGPDFSWPAAPSGPVLPGQAGYPPRALPPTAPSAPNLDPALSLPKLKARRGATPPRAVDGWPPPRTERSTFRSGRFKLSLGLLAAFTLLAVIPNLIALTTGTSSRTPPTYQTPRARPSQQPAVWNVKAEKLRPELPEPTLISSIDGSFDGVRVIDAGKAWLVLSGDKKDASTVLHGLAPGTGAELWRRDLPSGLCSRTLVKGAALCASATATDPATGLGTAWHLALLDPATGKERRGTEFDGWLTLIYAAENRALLVEQRQPAPHAVVTGLNPDLTRAWRLDLRDQPQHAGLFSENRVYDRDLPIPDGPALDRPRIRTVAHGLTALWAGQTTAFFNLADGTLVGMPRCSRLVDDGERLWCNQGEVAAALNYRIKPLYETDLGTRLAFPHRDPRAGDITDPVFLTRDGKAVRLNLATGRTIGPLVNTRNGSAFGMVTSPQTAYVAGLTLVWDDTAMFAVNARTGELAWQVDRKYFSGEVFDWNGRILLAGSDLAVVDRGDGATLSQADQPYGLYTDALDDVLVGNGPDEIARLVNP